jgi:hypothetical protein
MIPYKVKIFLSDDPADVVAFESNEKPLKGEVLKIQDLDKKTWDIKITEVTKFISRSKDDGSVLEYHCKMEKHEETAATIGFGKRS